MVANAGIEVMHSQGRGTNGHIAIGTYNVERAVAYLQTMGLTVEEGSQAYDAKGKMKVCYFKEAIGGFAIHLLKY